MNNNQIIFNSKNKTIKNHVVPQTYLKFFRSSEKNDIYVYDKNSKAIFQTGISNVAAKNKLYVIEDKESNIYFSWEDYYTKQVDNTIKPVFYELLSNTECIVNMKPLYNYKLRLKLINIILHQTMRVPDRIYSNFEEFFNELEEDFKKASLSKSRQENIYKSYIFDILNKIARKPFIQNILLNKTWIVFCNHTKTDFITSDNPVVIYDYKENHVSINNGIDTPTTMLSYPISPKYMISIFPNEFLAGALKLINNFGRINCYDSNLIESYNNRQYLNSTRQIYARKKSDLKLF